MQESQQQTVLNPSAMSEKQTWKNITNHKLDHGLMITSLNCQATNINTCTNIDIRPCFPYPT